MESEQIKKTLEPFTSRDDIYLKLAETPPVSGHHNLFRLKPYLKEELGFKINRLFLPLTYNGEPLWYLDCNHCYMNESYDPFAALFYVIRDHCSELVSFVDGYRVGTKEDYLSLREQFNNLLFKLKINKGEGPAGKASVDEFVRLGSLFYILQLCCKQVEGLKISGGNFKNDWGGDSLTINVDKSLYGHQRKLKNTYLSTLNWSEFFFRYAEKTKEGDLWFFNLAELEDGYGHCDVSDLAQIVTEFSHSISMRGGKVVITMPSTEEFKKLIIRDLSMEKLADDDCNGRYSNGRLILKTDVAYYARGKDFLVFQNFVNEKETQRML